MYISTTIIRFRILPFIICLLLGGSVQAQGFFTQTDQMTGVFNARIEQLPDGYLVKTTKYDILQDTLLYIFSEWHLNGAGDEISLDTITTRRLHIPKAGGYTWLRDNDLLELRNLGFNQYWSVKKSHLNGTPLWSYNFPQLKWRSHYSGATQNPAGEIFIAGGENDNDASGGAASELFYKFSASGQVLWQLYRPVPDSFYVTTSLMHTNDGGCLFSNRLNKVNTIFYTLGRVSSTGQVLWADTVDYFAKRLAENNEGALFFYGEQYDSGSVNIASWLEKRSASGQIIWRKNLNTLFQKLRIITESNPILANDGTILIAGRSAVDDEHYDNFFARFDGNGNLLWVKQYSFMRDVTTGYISATQTQEGGYLITGTDQLPSYQLFALKTDANGQVFPGQLLGEVAFDDNLNCLVDSAELAVRNWVIQLKNPEYHLYSSSDSSGHYAFEDVPEGAYALSIANPFQLWETCSGVDTVSIPAATAPPLQHDFPVQTLAECPYMVVDISTPALRRCFTAQYAVQYCNAGTLAADSAYVEITLDSLLHPQNASIPYTQNGQVLHFPLGQVQPLACDQFYFTVTVDCALQLGESACVSAAIFPDSLCHPPAGWSGALLQGSGACAGDSVRFQLHNIGTAPSSAGLQSYVVDEHVIMFQQPLPSIPQNGLFEISVPANGHTQRLISEQEPNAPGMEMPSIGVEGCGSGFNWGFLLQFPNHDGNPFTDTDCHEVVGAYDPNDKQAFPIGVGDEHFIEPNQPLEYQIRFQNTGTDTAFTVLIRDTISAWLDPASIRPGAASHPYTWTLSGEGVLTFTFEHILLPDSNINEAASHGFIQFGIQQRKDLLPGTRLENRAGIYFDFNEPVITNTVYHTIGQDFLPLTDAREPAQFEKSLLIWPNPADNNTCIELGKDVRPGQYLVLRNALGQIVRNIPVKNTTVPCQRSGLPPGCYFVEWRDANSLLGRGKLIWK